MDMGLLRAGAALIALGLVACESGYARGGPLAVNTDYGVETHAGPDGVVSWGLVVPAVSSGEPAVIESVTPEGVSGLTVLAVLASDPKGLSIGTAPGWPSPSSAFVDAIGSATGPGDASLPRLQIVFVVRLDGAEGRITGVRLRYRRGSARYEEVYNWSLTVRPEGVT